MAIFKKKHYVPLPPVSPAPGAPPSDGGPAEGYWIKCPSCGRTVYRMELGEYKICPHCGGYFRMKAWERIPLIADEESFEELDAGMRPLNPLNFPEYEQKMQRLKETTGLNDAVVCGRCTIEDNPVYLAVMDGDFIMGSMGSVVGEKITRLFENALAQNAPAVVFTVSGGARMQEGIISLMQMAKVSAAVQRHNDAGLLYVTVLTDPTTGGVTASFAMLGDIILAEPKALVGFAGRRVIEQTIKESLPQEFQSAEFVLEHGFVDRLVDRQELRRTLGTILRLHHEEKRYVGV